MCGNNENTEKAAYKKYAYSIINNELTYGVIQRINENCYFIFTGVIEPQYDIIEKKAR